jgi:predicted ATPase/class 3 adenylate cyclase
MRARLPMRELPTGTVTFLFTDVEGSTRLLHEQGAEAYAQALAEHRRVIREACAAAGGVEVDTQGDAFFFAFPTAQGAVGAASSFTEALASGPIQVRVGLHTGTPLLTDEGYIGDDVHFGARVASSGHGGQVVVSAATAKLVELSLTDLGEHRLKDISQAVPIYQLGDGSFPPLKTISNTNLPRPASSFVGRDDELLEVLSRFEAGARLVTLSGPGGTGKTRLAIEAAAELVPEFKAGVFWVGLATLRDAALVTETISQTLGAKDGLAEHIGERELLLLIDNLEQVVDCAPELATLLETCPNLRLLVTSRELLRVRGEVEYAVPPLAEEEAVSLFCERSQLDPDETIAELCRRLDDLPLAVELAAARTSVLSPTQILERLSQRLDLLKGGRDAEARQQTLRATIEWSYELLSPEEQQLFARLAVFAGGCTLEAAEQVVDADLDTLQSLVEKSLLRFTNERYWMLETIREYADEALQAAGAADALRRQGRWVTDLALEAEGNLEGGDQTAWLDRLEVERDNIRAALRCWLASGQRAEVLAVAARCWRFWWMRGYWDEGRMWLAEGLTGNDSNPAAPKALDGAVFLAYLQRDFEATRRLAEQQLQAARAIHDPVAAAKALHMLGNVTLETDERRDAQALYEQSLSLSTDQPFARYTLHALGYIALLDGDVGRARMFLERSLAVSEAHGDESAVADTLGVLGFTELCDRKQAEAVSHLRESARIAAELGDKPVLATRCLQGAAALLAERGASRDAARILGAADQLLEEMGATTPGQLAELIQHRTLDAIRRELDPAEVARERTLGRSMTSDEALGLALASID